jgi:hypothetical protein
MISEDSPILPIDYSKLPREAKKTNDTTFDRIYKYFFNTNTRIELTEEEQRISSRWERAWLFLNRHRGRKAVADLLMRQFGISQSVAFDDVKKAMHLFGTSDENVKSAKRAIAEEAFLKGADKAWKDGNLEMYHKFMKEYAAVNQLDAETNNTIAENIKNLKPQTINIVADPTKLMNQAREIQNALAQDIDFIESTNEKGEGTND